MDGEQVEEETKICSNCKRDIPRVNFLVHSVHCARNIRTCATCKEPVPLAELQDHHDRLHKLQPCQACGERVCGSDLEDHVRDSCANTVRPCRFCELELPRKKLPTHEGYCGSRTEQCAECREWVQLKYRQLHLDSNHGFIKLDDEPPPTPQLPRPTTRQTSNQNASPSSSTAQPTANGSTTNGLANALKQINLGSNGSFLKPVPNTSTSNGAARPSTSILTQSSSPISSGSDGPSNDVQSRILANCLMATDVLTNGLGIRPKRTNDRPQVNTSVAGASKVGKDSSSRGAIKKRPAPKPPTPCPQRDNILNSALARQSDEEAARRKQNAYNAAVGLPPVLSAAEKLEKLRKMDALHNRETAEPDYSQRLRGQCWQTTDVPVGELLGRGEGVNPRNMVYGEDLRSEYQYQEAGDSGAGRSPRQLGDLKPMSQEEFLDRYQQIHTGQRPAPSHDLSQYQDRIQAIQSGLRQTEVERRRMQEVFQEVQRGLVAASAGVPAAVAGARDDRFSEIKTSLRELRRGLNEVTAPYNASGYTNNNGSSQAQSVPPSTSADDVRLPCEFCDMLVPPDQLLLHQTGCRPDLVGYPPSPRSPSPPPRRDSEPVIPCEFCTESLPVYLINEHQERCRRENDQLYLD